MVNSKRVILGVLGAYCMVNLFSSMTSMASQSAFILVRVRHVSKYCSIALRLMQIAVVYQGLIRMSFISSLCLLDRHRLFTIIISFHMQRSVHNFDCVVNTLPKFFQLSMLDFSVVLFIFLTVQFTEYLRFFLYSFFADNNNKFY